MKIETSSLPTHIATVARRFNAVGVNASSDAFLTLSYLAESAIKTIAAVLHANLRERSAEHAYRRGYDLVRADGLGSWDTAIREMTQTPVATFLTPDVRTLLKWLTVKRSGEENEDFLRANAAAENILAMLGSAPVKGTRAVSCRDLISRLVEIRNKTKAHGAVGADFYVTANVLYADSVTFLLSAPCFSWTWLHLSVRDTKGNVRGIRLSGLDIEHVRDAEAETMRPAIPGMHFLPGTVPKAYACAPILISNRECTAFFLPNGGYRDDGTAEFIDYGSGVTSRESVAVFQLPPAPLPGSATEGQPTLDVQSNVFGNLPPAPQGYVTRPELEEELRTRLLDRNHSIITLHGRGGIGKTSLALKSVHEFASEKNPRFDHIIWFSARDIELKTGGATPVRPTVTDVTSVASAYGKLFGDAESVEGFAEVLQSSRRHSETGILFIFDNFETLLDATALHQFLDAHTHQPNKVLITSRERAFKADYPIEVGGMSRDESFKLMKLVAA